MILKCLFIACFTVLVSTNVGSQIIPAQTYPIYQQNGFLNPSPNLRDPYQQRNTVQNPSAAVNLSPSAITQLLLNTILSDPSLQTIVDPNVGNYGSNQYVYPNNQISSNAVNNYLPVLTERMNNGTPEIYKESKIHENQSEKKSKRKNRRKPSKSRRKHDDEEISVKKSSKKERKNKNDEFQSTDNSRKGKKKSKKHSHKQNSENTADDVSNRTKYDKNENHKTSKSKRRKSKVTNETKNSPTAVENELENVKPRRRRKKKKSNPDKTNNDYLGNEMIINDKLQKVLKEDIDVANFNEGITEENRFARNLLQENKDIVSSYPKIPENIPNNFFQNLPHFDNANPSMNNYFANFENIYKSFTANNMNVNEKRRRKPIRARNNHKRKIVNKNKNINTVAATTSNSTKISTEKTIYIDAKIPPKIEPKPEVQVPKMPDEQIDLKEKGTELPQINDFKDEYYEHLPENVNNENVYEGYIDDYYPLFTDSAAYNANHREFYIKNIGNNKYYYAADNFDTDTIKNLKHQEYILPEPIIREYERNKQFYQIENSKNSTKGDENPKTDEVIEFRAPPGLEMPDFQTRKIDRTEIKSDYYTYSTVQPEKISTYSETKISYNGDKINDIRNQPKEKVQKDVETVFAKSKVVKYGPVYNSEEEDDDNDSDFAGSSNHVMMNNDMINNGDTVYVLAKSLDFPDY